MKNGILNFAMIASISLSQSVDAFTVWTLKGKKFDRKKPVHVLVAGYSKGLSNQFVQTAGARMLKYEEMYPTHNVVLFQPQVEEFQIPSIELIHRNSAPLLGETLVNELLRFSEIKNLDFFAHSSAHQGIGLETDGYTMPEQSFYATSTDSNPVAKYRKGTPELSKLRKVLSKDAWVTINGCNSGWIQAPALSEIIKRPVLAALTGSDFEKLFEDGKYYFNNPGFFPNIGNWAVRNTESYNNVQSCVDGACLRLKPQPTAYNGHWGNYSNVGSLGFYKFFCNYKGFESTCYKAMARSLQLYLSTKNLNSRSSKNDYLEVLFDFICPNPPSDSRQMSCEESIKSNLISGNENFNPYSSKPLDCTLQGCKVKSLQCQYFPEGNAVAGSCRFEADPNANGDKTLMREFKNYLRGLSEIGVRN